MTSPERCNGIGRACSICFRHHFPSNSIVRAQPHRHLGWSRLVRTLAFWLAWHGVALSLWGSETARRPGVAVLTTEYRHNSHADVIASRLVLTDMLDGTGNEPRLRMASVYTDQRPPNDISRLLAASHRFRVSTNIEDALTLGTGRLAVEGVLLIAEHGQYPKSATGNTVYPKRRFWDETMRVFRASGRVVPVFVDKHLADNWDDARHIRETARELGVPLMAGSSVPGSWRHPAVDVPPAARLSSVLVVTYGSTDHYGFHALECLQALVEQREGGETGVLRVQGRVGPQAWSGLAEPGFDPALLPAAMGRLGVHEGIAAWKAKVERPVLWDIEYKDGLRARVVELNGVANGWAGAWRRIGDPGVEATRFWTQEARPAAHFTLLLHGIEEMMLSGRPTWGPDRTLMTSGLLDALLRSGVEGGHPLATPWLEWSYASSWRWKEPPPPPPSRPWSEQ
ncbi:MAG: hypothetical protein WCR07_14080 [Verrucomicrobiota bacterium]